MTKYRNAAFLVVSLVGVVVAAYQWNGWLGTWTAMAAIGLGNSLVSSVGYHHISYGSWRFYVMGRHLMAWPVAFAWLFGVLLYALLWGPIGPMWWTMALTPLLIVLVQRTWLLFTSEWRKRDQHPSYSDYTQE